MYNFCVDVYQRVALTEDFFTNICVHFTNTEEIVDFFKKAICKKYKRKCFSVNNSTDLNNLFSSYFLVSRK